MGPAGADGAVGATGAAGVVWRGAWDSNGTYAANDAVSLNGSSYRNTSGNNAGSPDSDSNDWSLLASKGDTGATGAQGADGAAGAQGQQGPAGAQGPAGPAGAQGEAGAQGPAGPQGPQGQTGATGAQGPQGATGAQGAQGPQGLTGAAGATGPQGPAGADGSPDTGDQIVTKINGSSSAITAASHITGITDSNISAGSLTAASIANGTITGGKIAPATIAADRLAAGVIPTSLPAAGLDNRNHRFTAAFTDATTAAFYNGTAGTEFITVPANQTYSVMITGTGIFTKANGGDALTLDAAYQETDSTGTTNIGSLTGASNQTVLDGGSGTISVPFAIPVSGTLTLNGGASAPRYYRVGVSALGTNTKFSSLANTGSMTVLIMRKN
jgi:hypothetical protein